jgi:hypothetical protein
MHPRYFWWIGRRGGRKRKQREYEAYAATLPPEQAEAWLERAEEYAVETGNHVMAELWTKAELDDEEPKKKRGKRKGKGGAE